MTMNSFERRNKIIQLVNEQGTVLVQDLAGVFAASEATIRADLRFLEQKGVVTRFHGGAAKIMSGNSETETQEVGFKERFQLASAPKNRIAQAAVKMIHEGMTVILDSGSTTMLIAEGLMTAKNITVILLWSSVVAPSAIKRARCMVPLPSVHCRILMPI